VEGIPSPCLEVCSLRVAFVFILEVSVSKSTTASILNDIGTSFDLVATTPFVPLLLTPEPSRVICVSEYDGRILPCTQVLSLPAYLQPRELIVSLSVPDDIVPVATNITISIQSRPCLLTGVRPDIAGRNCSLVNGTTVCIMGVSSNSAVPLAATQNVCVLLIFSLTDRNGVKA
jgi:hypothetical protein